LNDLRAKANAFHKVHPEVWDLFVKFAFEQIRAGAKHSGSKAIFERIRWEVSLRSEPGEFKVNNNYAPLYARRFHRVYPEHDGFFRTRVASVDLATQGGEAQCTMNH